LRLTSRFNPGELAHLDAEGEQLENKLYREDASKDHVQVIKHVRVHFALPVKLLYTTLQRNSLRQWFQQNTDITVADCCSVGHT